MKILFLAYRSPWPPITGDRLRVWQHIEFLAEEHEITLVTFDTLQEAAAPLSALTQKCKAVHIIPLDRRLAILRTGMALAFSKDPLQVAYYHDTRLMNLVHSLVQNAHFDLMYLSLVRTAPYGLEQFRIPRLLDFCDALSLQFERRAQIAPAGRRLLFRLEARRLLKYERRLAMTFDKTIISSAVDASHIGTSRPPTVVPIAVGIEPEISEIASSPLPSGNLNIAFLGDMSTDYSESALVYFREEIWPTIHAKLPQAVLWIIGRDPTPAIQSMASSCIKVTGSVSSFQPYLEQMQVAIAPLKSGTGVKYRVLQPMAVGVPVVASTIVNEGLGAENGKEIMLSDDAPEFAKMVITLLEDSAIRCKVGDAGQKFVLEKFDVNTIREQLYITMLEAIEHWSIRNRVRKALDTQSE